MEGETLHRKLAAVVHADAVGFSRLMSADERGTVAALEACRSLFRECVTRHGGRVVDTAGDSVLAVFESVVEAVSCAIAVQQSLRTKSDAVPADQRLRFRIGVNLGDVITRPDGTVYGDGVNLAARIESLAEAGGVAIAGSVYESIAGKLNVGFVDIGEQEVKNIARPVRVYRVEMPRPELGEALTPRSVKAAATGQEKPDKPSIAVLPFNNMSGDPEQEFFADGITEDLITELSRFRELFVISRNSSFKYKGKPVDVQKFAAELGVQYVVEGSVRKAGNRVRITVQLIDAESDHHLWAERYDRELADIFEIQDEVTRAIVAILPGRVEAAARDRAARKHTDNMAAYECVITGKLLHHRSNRDDNARALRLLERAIQLDPSYAHAHAWKACVLGQSWVYGWCADRQLTFDELNQELKLALSLDDNDSDVHRVLAASNLTQGQHEKALFHQSRALHLNPNDDLIVVQQGEVLSWMGNVEEGIDWIRKAMRLNPYHPERFWSHLGRAQFIGRRYAEAIESFKRIAQPDHIQHAFLAACHAYLGEDAQAREHARQVLAREPKFSVSEYIEALRHYQRAEDREHHREGLLKAGLPA